jgi:hypothetical protein
MNAKNKIMNEYTNNVLPSIFINLFFIEAKDAILTNLLA